MTGPVSTPSVACPTSCSARPPAVTLAFILCWVANAALAESPQMDPRMREVLETLEQLGAQPLHSLDVQSARAQASPADAVLVVRRVRNVSPLPGAAVETRDIAVPTPAGALAARLYRPDASGPLPIIVYFHGGGWVVGDFSGRAPRINLVGRTDLYGLPSTTVVTAEMAHLRSEGKIFAEKMRAAGVAVNLMEIPGVTHAFFGMTKVVDKAKSTVETASADLRKAFAKSEQ